MDSPHASTCAKCLRSTLCGDGVYVAAGCALDIWQRVACRSVGEPCGVAVRAVCNGVWGAWDIGVHSNAVPVRYDSGVGDFVRNA